MSLLALTDDRRPACHSFQNGCACERCADRDLRSRVYRAEGRSNAATAAQRDSDDYFATPWRFDRSSPPMRLAA